MKVKCVASEAFFIVGYEPSSALPTGFGSLLLGAYRDGTIVDVGSVGTGFSQAEATRLRKMLDKLRWKQKQPPVPYAGEADIVWVHPTLIAEIEFRAWTSDGKLRHAVYKGLRERQDNADVHQLDQRIAHDAPGYPPSGLKSGDRVICAIFIAWKTRIWSHIGRRTPSA